MVGANTLPDSITSKLYFKFLTLHFHLECGNWKDRQSYTHYLGGMWSLSCKWGFRNRDKRNVSHQPLGSHLNLIIYVSDGGILPLIIFTPLACVSDGSMAIARSVGQDQPSAGRTRWQINHFHHWKKNFNNIKQQKLMAWFLLSIPELIKYGELKVKTSWHDWLLLSSSLQCNHQATALKTSSGKGDLQCSATNAGDWVCILLLYPNSEKVWSAFVVLFPFEWNDHPNSLSSPNHLPTTRWSSRESVVDVVTPGLPQVILLPT